jgi:hypothetical protein
MQDALTSGWDQLFGICAIMALRGRATRFARQRLAVTPSSDNRTPKNTRRHIVVADSTIFTTLFGGTPAQERLWRNVAAM